MPKLLDYQEQLPAFREWLLTIRPRDLESWLMDAFWKGQLVDTELYRFFLLSRRGVDMRTTPIQTNPA